MAEYVRDDRAGAVVVGSHVKKTTQQLEALLQMPGIAPIEVDVEQIDRDRQALLDGSHPADKRRPTSRVGPR